MRYFYRKIAKKSPSAEGSAPNTSCPRRLAPLPNPLAPLDPANPLPPLRNHGYATDLGNADDQVMTASTRKDKW